MGSFWKNAGILAFAELFLKLKALFMMPFITKYLGTMNYGIWSQVMVIVAVLTPLVFCGMDSSLMRFLPGRSLNQQRRDFTGWILFGLASSAVLCGFVTLLSHPISDLFFGTEADYPIFVILAGLNIVTTALLSGIRNWFRVQNCPWPLVAITLVQNFAQMSVLIWVLLAEKGIFELVVWSLVADGLLIGGYAAHLMKSKIFAKPSWEWLKPYFRFGIVLLPSGYAVWVLNSLDRVFLAQYHTLADIGVYSICFTIGYTLIQVIVNPIWNLFPAKSAELYNTQKFGELNTLFNQSIKLICWFIFPSILGLLLVGNPLLHFLTTDEFAAGYLVVPIILAGYLCSMLSSYFETILALRNKPYLSSIFTVSACIINIILNFALIPKFSYIGAAVATTLSFGLQLMMSVFCASKEDLVTLDKQPLFKICLASLGMLLLTYAAESYWFDLSTFWGFFCLIALGISVYMLLTMGLKIYNFHSLLQSFRKGFANV